MMRTALPVLKNASDGADRGHRDWTSRDEVLDACSVGFEFRPAGALGGIRTPNLLIRSQML